MQELWLQKRKKMTDSNVSDVKMTRFGNRVYLFTCQSHEAKIASRGTDYDIIGEISL